MKGRRRISAQQFPDGTELLLSLSCKRLVHLCPDFLLEFLECYWPLLEIKLSCLGSSTFSICLKHAREVASIFISCVRQAEYNLQFMFSSKKEKLKFVENHRKRSEHNCEDVGYHFVINSHPTKHCVTTRNLWLAAFSRQRKQNLEIFLPQGKKRNKN